jgi:hypothetical protein
LDSAPKSILLKVREFCVLLDVKENREDFHVKIFDMLYASCHPILDDQIAAQIHINVKTLYRYKLTLERIVKYLLYKPKSVLQIQ